MVIAIGPKCSKTMYTYSNSHIYTRGPTVAQEKFIPPLFLYYDFILGRILRMKLTRGKPRWKSIWKLLVSTRLLILVREATSCPYSTVGCSGTVLQTLSWLDSLALYKRVQRVRKNTWLKVMAVDDYWCSPSRPKAFLYIDFDCSVNAWCMAIW